MWYFLEFGTQNRIRYKNNNQMKRIKILLYILLVATTAKAQNVILLSYHDFTTIQLRWIPNDTTVWQEDM